LVLGPPIFRTSKGRTERIVEFQRVVVSARDIARLYVTYVDSLEPSADEEDTAEASG